MISEDRGDTWQVVDTFPDGNGIGSDLVYRDGLFVATTGSIFVNDEGRVLVSSDGIVWNEVVHDQGAGLFALLHDGDQFVVAGYDSTVLTSLDGVNSTETQTPVEEVDYLSAASSGSRLLLAGSSSSWFPIHGGPPPFDIPLGLSSTDGGLS